MVMTDWNNIALEHLSKSAYDSWGQYLSFKGVCNGKAKFSVPAEFFRALIKRSHEKDIIAVFAACGIDIVSVDVKVESVSAQTAENESSLSVESAKNANDNQMAENAPFSVSAEDDKETSFGRNTELAKTDSQHTFDNFVVGESNYFAYALAKKTAEGQCHGGNPLFFYSSVGLGKTHLMQAIANKMIAEGKKNVIYMGADKYLRMFVKASTTKDNAASLVKFKETFRAADILMIDDIQMLAGKEKTEQELLATFDELIDEGKQIVLSASKAPSAITGISERLKNRMAAGIVADIMPADYNLRLQILRKKAELMKCSVPDEVLAFLADKIPSNIRELEGALRRVVAHAQLMNETPSMTRAAAVLKDLLIANEERIVSINEIKNKVAVFYKIKPADLTSPSREKCIAVPRQIAMYMAKTLTTKSYPEIAREFNRDHTTVIHGVKKVETLLKEDKNVYEQINMIRGSLV